MRSRNRPCDHSRITEQIQKYEDQDRRFVAEVERLLAPHKPALLGFGQDSLRPGNSHDKVPLHCEACRTGWPCQTFNDLRHLFGVVHEWEPATRPYERVVVRLAPKGEQR